MYILSGLKANFSCFHSANLQVANLPGTVRPHVPSCMPFWNGSSPSYSQITTRHGTWQKSGSWTLCIVQIIPALMFWGLQHGLSCSWQGHVEQVVPERSNHCLSLQKPMNWCHVAVRSLPDLEAAMWTLWQTGLDPHCWTTASEERPGPEQVSAGRVNGMWQRCSVGEGWDKVQTHCQKVHGSS